MVRRTVIVTATSQGTTAIAEAASIASRPDRASPGDPARGPVNHAGPSQDRPPTRLGCVPHLAYVNPLASRR
jgi:hypothetical protein